jgi:predicted lipoprotein with Yx(FWY)xxD motif
MLRALLVTGIAVAMLATGTPPLDGDPAMANERDKAVTKLTLKSSPYGRVLFSGGYAMYVFTRDDGSRSRCYGECAEAWPPLEADGRLVAGPGVKQRRIGTTTRRDGGTQVTYRGRPLYGYIDDPRGQVLCHDVFEFGGTWYAVRGSGRPAP